MERIILKEFYVKTKTTRKNILKRNKKQYYFVHFHQRRKKIDELLFYWGEHTKLIKSIIQSGRVSLLLLFL